jgi:hypothetical protein
MVELLDAAEAWELYRAHNTFDKEARWAYSPRFGMYQVFTPDAALTPQAAVLAALRTKGETDATEV